MMSRKPTSGTLLAMITLAALAGPAASQSQPVPSAEALVTEAIRHEHAEGVPRDPVRAHDLYCAAARQGHGDALHRLGWMYANGRGVPRNDATAHALVARAAAQGSTVAARLAGMVRPAGTASPQLPECLSARPRTARAAVAPTDSPQPAAALRLANLARIDDLARFAPAQHTPERRQLVAAVLAESRKQQVDPRLVFAVMRAESNFEPAARSPRNAQGLMQLIPETAERFAVGNILDPGQNIRGGIRYLRWLLSYFKGDVDLVLAAYNSGEGTVDRFGGLPPYPETAAYVRRIRARYPHSLHPFDPEAAGRSSRIVAQMPAERPDVAVPVRYFLGTVAPGLAQSHR